MMTGSLRLRIIRSIWIAFAFAITMLMVTNIVAETTPGIAEIILGAIISGAAMISTIVVWVEGEEKTLDATQSEKAKRQQHDLDDMLDTLSEAQLARLRERLMLDEPEVMMLHDDGELLSMNQRR